jgi:predicted XRE-type DNA-binding protein
MTDDLPEHEVGSDNIFADIGLRDAETHLLKAQLVSRLADLIEERRLTQAQAAKILGIGQPDVSRMLRGHFRDYSVERLMRFLTAFDQDVTIEVRPKPADRPEARLTVAGPV